MISLLNGVEYFESPIKNCQLDKYFVDFSLNHNVFADVIHFFVVHIE